MTPLEAWAAQRPATGPEDIAAEAKRLGVRYETLQSFALGIDDEWTKGGDPEAFEQGQAYRARLRRV
jgi:hypothetical protein